MAQRTTPGVGTHEPTVKEDVGFMCPVRPHQRGSYPRCLEMEQEMGFLAPGGNVDPYTFSLSSDVLARLNGNPRLFFLENEVAGLTGSQEAFDCHLNYSSSPLLPGVRFAPFASSPGMLLDHSGCGHAGALGPGGTVLSSCASADTHQAWWRSTPTAALPLLETPPGLVCITPSSPAVINQVHRPNQTNRLI